MTALVWVLAVLPHVLPAISKLPPPVNLTLNSTRFIHVLRWRPGPGTPPGVHYTVTVCKDTEASCMPVAGCERVQHPLVCNLTQAFSEPTEVYWTRVAAGLEARSSDQVHYPEFKPLRDTHLDLPRLTVTPCNGSLCVGLQPPVEDLRYIYELLWYKLRIRSHGVEAIKDTRFFRRSTEGHVAPGREYCVSVRFFDDVSSRKSNYSHPVCVSIPVNYDTDALISVGLCFLVMAALVTVALLVAAGYICLTERPLPQVLTSIQHTDDDLLVHSNSRSSLLTVRATTPPAGHRQTLPEDSDEESLAEGGGGTARGYELPGGAPHLASSSSSSTLPAPPPPEASSSSEQASDLVSPRPVEGGPPSAETPSVADPPAVAPTAGGVENKEEVGEEGSQDVDLLTLTFGVQAEEEEEEEEDKSHEESPAAPKDIAPDLPAQTWSGEEEEEEDSEYIRHPTTRDSQALI